MKTVLIEPHYLPSLEYFCAILPFDRVVLEKHEHYVKQSDSNRCFINTAHGTQMLVVPLKEKHGKVVMKDVRIDYTSKWQNNQWRTVRSAYAKAPFFEYYADDLEKAIYGNYENLFDLNRVLLSFCLRSLGLTKELSETVAYEKEADRHIFDLRRRITSKKAYSGRALYTPHPYYQVFGSSFAENLSLIDLVFCEGPGALRILQASGREELNK